MKDFAYNFFIRHAILFAIFLMFAGAPVYADDEYDYGPVQQNDYAPVTDYAPVQSDYAPMFDYASVQSDYGPMYDYAPVQRDYAPLYDYGPVQRDYAPLYDYSPRTYDYAPLYDYSQRNYDYASPYDYSARNYDYASPYDYAARNYDYASPYDYASRNYDYASPYDYSQINRGSSAPFYSDRPFGGSGGNPCCTSYASGPCCNGSGYAGQPCCTNYGSRPQYGAPVYSSLCSCYTYGISGGTFGGSIVIPPEGPGNPQPPDSPVYPSHPFSLVNSPTYVPNYVGYDGSQQMQTAPVYNTYQQPQQYQNAVYNGQGIQITQNQIQVAANIPYIAAPIQTVIASAAHSAGPMVALSQVPYTGVDSDILLTTVIAFLALSVIGAVIYFFGFFKKGMFGRMIIGLY